MFNQLVSMKTDLEMLKTAFSNSLKVGPVAKLDAKKGFRIRLGGTDAEPYLSPWYPHPESGGKTKTWMPLSVGQIMGVMNPIGDQRQGLIFRGGFSDEFPAPSQDLEENVFEFAGLRISIKDGKMTITGDVHVLGELLRHNDKNIGDTHNHGGIMPGPANTDVPNP